jgi:branched-chain amino acid transport system substrate-binding protein
VEGSYFTTHFAADSDSELAQKFVTRYKEAYGKTPIDAAAATYDAMGLLFKAITSQGKTDPEAIRQGIANLGQYQGVTGDIEYKGSGDPIKSAVILQIQDGEFRFYANASP